jgi:TPR repeat protein
MVGVEGVLPQSDVEAYLWAKKAAEMGLAKAQYAVGYFTEVRPSYHTLNHTDI